MGRIYTPEIPAFGKGSDSSLGCHGHLGQIHSSTLHFLQFIPLLQLLEIPCPPDGECADQNLHLLKSSNAGEFVGGPQMHWEEILSISVERGVLNTPNLFVDGFVPLRGKETQQFIHFFFLFFSQLFIPIFSTDTPRSSCDGRCGSVTAELTADPRDKSRPMEQLGCSGCEPAPGCREGAAAGPGSRCGFPESSPAPAANGPSWS